MASLDPLDREVFQKAFDAARSVLKADELDSDESLKPHCVENYSRSLCLTE